MPTYSIDIKSLAEKRSFIEVAERSQSERSQYSDFPIQNLPYGVFKPTPESAPRVGVAIGSYVLDLSVLAEQGLLGNEAKSMHYFSDNSLNRFMSCGRAVWTQTRATIMTLLSHDCPTLRDNEQLRSQSLYERAKVTLQMPIQVTAYTDFYSSLDHARNVGTLIRGPENALNPNWKQLPIAYNGRHSAIGLSGEPCVRPWGQIKPNEESPPIHTPTRSLDFELELGYVIGTPSARNSCITPDRAEEHVFGAVLFNDWSARDIQKWEYQPLGPFNGKNFFSSISPWIVTLEALEPFKVAACPQEPEPLHYLRSPRMVYDINLGVSIRTQKMAAGESHPITSSNARFVYWDLYQQLTHLTAGGNPVQTGEIFATGTLSGPTADSLGCLLEMTKGGKAPLTLPSGEQRTFLLDGDSIIFRGHAQNEQFRVGFGKLENLILPATN
jgi:fumarylacetoacetase